MAREEPSREMREERSLMLKRLERLNQMTGNTVRRRKPWAVQMEIETLKANLASLEKRYRFD